MFALINTGFDAWVNLLFTALCQLLAVNYFGKHNLAFAFKPWKIGLCESGSGFYRILPVRKDFKNYDLDWILCSLNKFIVCPFFKISFNSSLPGLLCDIGNIQPWCRLKVLDPVIVLHRSCSYFWVLRVTQMHPSLARYKSCWRFVGWTRGSIGLDVWKVIRLFGLWTLSSLILL